MVNYDNYTYNPKCVFYKQSRKDRLEKQLGDFGEQLVMTLLSRIAKYSVAYVDHEGADLIAIDPKNNDKKYAISVKSGQIGPNENETKVFENADQEKLCNFSRDFGLIPTVAMVFIPKDFAFIDVYLITLDAFIELSKKQNNKIETEAIKKTKKGLQINNYSLGTGKNNINHSDKKGYLQYLQSNDLIEHIRLDVHNRDNFREGIRQVSEDGAYDTKCIDQLIKNETSKDGNLSRQLGDAGEYLLTMLLGQQKKFKVARVDHVGADLIAADSEGNRYAISVKTRQNTSYEFYELYTTGSIKTPKRELGKLKDFADKYNMIPVVACIFIKNNSEGKNNFKGMDIYISSLDNWIKKAGTNSCKAISFNPLDKSEDVTEASLRWQETMKTFKINIEKQEYREYLNNSDGIEHIEIDFMSSFNPKMKWK